VKAAIKKKEEAKKAWEISGSLEDKEAYRQANKKSKKAVASAKSRELETLYEELDTKEGEKNIYRMANNRDRSKKDFTHIKKIKDNNGAVLKDEKDIKDRWKNYFNTILNEKNARIPSVDALPNLGLVAEIEREEVVATLKTMQNGKATGPNGISVEAWKSLDQDGLDIIHSMLTEIFEKETITDE